MAGTVVSYQSPPWASRLTFCPRSKVQLIMSSTPIHHWRLPGAPDDFSVSIKRDDLTGSVLTGNKARNQEFLLAEALEQACSHVISSGPIQSNYCRTVAAASRQVGLTPHLFVRSDAKDLSGLGCEGNLLLDNLLGAEIHLVPKSCSSSEVELQMEKLANKLQQEKGEKAYIILSGGSTHVGVFGYIGAFEEMVHQGVLDDFDDVVFASATGGTLWGLAIGNYLTGSRLRLHGIIMPFNESESRQYFYDRGNKVLQKLGLGHVDARSLCNVIEGHWGAGYDISTDEELGFIHNVACRTGIVLDTTYTGKAALGMVKEMRRNPSQFQGKRILFLHTGGVFGLFDGRLASFLDGTQQCAAKN